MKIGILQTGFVPKPLANEFGEYPLMFEQLLAGQGFEFETYAVADNHFPENVSVCNGWLVTGSVYSAYDDIPFISRLEDFINESYAASIPIVGICFGHQIMAQALGGKVEKYIDGLNIGGGLNIGQSAYRLADETIDLLAIHQDQVTKVPDGAEVILSNKVCKIAGLAYKGTAISFQPHPEFSSNFMHALIEVKTKNGMSQQQATLAKLSIKEDNDADKLATILSDFFKSKGSNKIS